MDVISFSEAATANSRIEKSNANPDSDSGILTQPMVIAAGETVTIPAGRVAILPNTVVNGEIVVEGELFIPSGATSADIEAQLGLKAPLISPEFTGTPIAPTASAGDNSTKIATTQFVKSEIVNDVGVANSPLIKTALNASGNAPIYACRAWVNFNGTNTVAIRASGNVSSITDFAVGEYGINFVTNMQDAAYAISGFTRHKPGVSPEGVISGRDYPAVETCSVYTTSGGSQFDPDFVYIAIFR